MSLLLAEDMTARDGMGYVGPIGVALEADVARRVRTDHKHDDRERKGLVKDSPKDFDKKNRQRKCNGYK